LLKRPSGHGWVGHLHPGAPPPGGGLRKAAERQPGPACQDSAGSREEWERPGNGITAGRRKLEILLTSGHESVCGRVPTRAGLSPIDLNLAPRFQNDPNRCERICSRSKAPSADLQAIARLADRMRPTAQIEEFVGPGRNSSGPAGCCGPRHRRRPGGQFWILHGPARSGQKTQWPGSSPASKPRAHFASPNAVGWPASRSCGGPEVEAARERGLGRHGLRSFLFHRTRCIVFNSARAGPPALPWVRRTARYPCSGANHRKNPAFRGLKQALGEVARRLFRACSP